MNIKMAASEEICEYCKCLLSDWLFWRWNGKSIAQSLVRNTIKINDEEWSLCLQESKSSLFVHLWMDHTK